MAKLLTSLRQFPERAHLVGAYALGKAQRVIALMREAGYDEPIFIHGALTKLCDYYESEGIVLGDIRPATLAPKEKQSFAGSVVIGPPSAFADKWARRFPDPVSIFASGWMLVRQRAKQRGVELPMIISDHCDWPELLDTIVETGAEDVWVTHGRDDALVYQLGLMGRKARALSLVGFEDEGE